MTNTIRIQALKYGNESHYEWETTLIEHTSKYLLVCGEANRKLYHHRKGKVYICENPSIEVFPFEEWFTVSVEKTTDGQLNYYCNISMPSVFSGSTVSFIDLDLDLVKRLNGDWNLVDEDELIENSRLYGYPPDLICRATTEANNLREKIDSCSFPFNGWLDDLVSLYLR